jgi:hypothetical protein
LGIRAIEYRPWRGTRTDPNRRWLVISKEVFMKNVRAKVFIVLLIFGMMLAHAFPIISSLLVPHDSITDEDMVGGGSTPEPKETPPPNYQVVDGDLTINGSLQINGTFTINGTIALNYEVPLENLTNISLGPNNLLDQFNADLGDGKLILNGTVMGLGLLGTYGGVTVVTGIIYATNFTTVSGVMALGNLTDLLSFNISDNGTGGLPGNGTFPPGDGQLDMIMGLFSLLSLVSTISGNGTITGSGIIYGNGTVVGEVNGTSEAQGPSIEIDIGGYLTNGLLIIFTMLLAAIICADVIAADLADQSFVLYFSRPVRSLDYLLGKFVGLMWVLWLFCLIPPIAYVLVTIGTMSGNDWGGAFTILGKTVLAGLLTAVYFLPYGLMISSFTKSKAYAGIGIFMSFFVLTIISGIFSGNSTKWTLIDPFALLNNFYQILFNGTITEGIKGTWVGAAIAAFIVVPAIVTYFWVDRKGAGK